MKTEYFNHIQLNVLLNSRYVEGKFANKAAAFIEDFLWLTYHYETANPHPFHQVPGGR